LSASALLNQTIRQAGEVTGAGTPGCRGRRLCHAGAGALRLAEGFTLAGGRFGGVRGEACELFFAGTASRRGGSFRLRKNSCRWRQVKSTLSVCVAKLRVADALALSRRATTYFSALSRGSQHVAMRGQLASRAIISATVV
jgi:hypothetical protein